MSAALGTPKQARVAARSAVALSPASGRSEALIPQRTARRATR
jgi:hypothetical protein